MSGTVDELNKYLSKNNLQILDEESRESFNDLVFLRFLVDNPVFKNFINHFMKFLENNLEAYLDAQNLKNSSAEELKKEKKTLFGKSLEALDKKIGSKIPECIRKPFELNLTGMIGRTINKLERQMARKISNKFIKPKVEEILKTFIVPEFEGSEKEEKITDDQNEWLIFCNINIKKIMENQLLLFDNQQYKLTPTEYNSLIKFILEIIQNSRRSFVMPVYEEFIHLNEEFIKLLPNCFDKVKALEECKVYFSVLNNRDKRKKTLAEANHQLEKLIRKKFSEYEKNYTLICILIGLSCAYISQGNNKGENTSLFKNQHYSPLAREMCRKILKYFKREASLRQSNASYYCLDKLLVFEYSLGKMLKEMHIPRAHDTFIDKEYFMMQEFNESIDLIKWVKEISNEYGKNEKYVKLLKLLLEEKKISESEGIQKLLDATKLLKIERVNENYTSRHAILCVSGFLQENDDQKRDWSKLSEFFPYSKIYNIRYKATSIHTFLEKFINISQLKEINYYKLFKIFIKKGLLERLKDLPKNHLGELAQIFDLNINDFIDMSSIQNEGKLKSLIQERMTIHLKQYDEAYKNATEAGALLAFIIALGAPLNIESISIVCYSLGTHLINECLCFLKKFECYNRIHDVIFLAGAAQIDVRPTNIRNFESYQIVRGKVFNCYSRIDLVLKALYLGYDTFRPIGKYEYQMQNPKKENSIIYNGKTFVQSRHALFHILYLFLIKGILIDLFKKYQK